MRLIGLAVVLTIGLLSAPLAVERATGTGGAVAQAPARAPAHVAPSSTPRSLSDCGTPPRFYAIDGKPTTYEDVMQQIPGGTRQAIANLRRQIDSGTLPPDTAEDFKRRIAYYECRIAIEGNAGAPAPPTKVPPGPGVDPLARTGPIPSQTPGAWFVIGVGGGAKYNPNGGTEIYARGNAIGCDVGPQDRNATQCMQACREGAHERCAALGGCPFGSYFSLALLQEEVDRADVMLGYPKDATYAAIGCGSNEAEARAAALATCESETRKRCRASTLRGAGKIGEGCGR
jgi:hypothetical protein